MDRVTPSGTPGIAPLGMYGVQAPNVGHADHDVAPCAIVVEVGELILEEVVFAQKNYYYQLGSRCVFEVNHTSNGFN